MNRNFTGTVTWSRQDAGKILQDHSHDLEDPSTIDLLVDKIGDSRIVMLGEASHGTHEYYTWRSRLSKRLILEKGFNFIAVEGDWPDCYRLNRYVKNYRDVGSSVREVLGYFNRWPTWMWANWEIVALVEWMWKFNQGLALQKKAGFYGLDVYSLWESMESILQYLEKTDPAAHKVALEAYQCFEPYHKQDGQAYARALHWVPEICEPEVIELLKKIRQRMPLYNSDHENVFNAEQNALVAVNAEKYYRAMIHGGPHSWNVRDHHMMDTLERLLAFHGKNAKAIVWAHNTHIGDARATDMSESGMYNIGELARLKFPGNEVSLVGFGSYQGTVVAGKAWGSPMRKVNMPSALENSWESLLHKACKKDSLILMEDLMEDVFLENHLGHRAIGVVYQSQYEQYGNYVPSILPLRYDIFLYLEYTKALHPLHIIPDGEQVPETFPFGV